MGFLDCCSGENFFDNKLLLNFLKLNCLFVFVVVVLKISEENKVLIYSKFFLCEN